MAAQAERGELAADPDLELGELAAIYQRRGLDEELARTIAGKLMAVNPLAAHVRDELGLSEELMARPVQAAVVSAVSFAVGATLPPFGCGAWSRSGSHPRRGRTVLGVLGCWAGWAAGWVGVALAGAGRVLAGGGLAMAATAVIGRLVGAVGL